LPTTAPNPDVNPRGARRQETTIIIEKAPKDSALATGEDRRRTPTKEFNSPRSLGAEEALGEGGDEAVRDTETDERL
jgi:hypothetical protein